MNKLYIEREVVEQSPCEYCGAPLPKGVDKKTRRIRSAHFGIHTAGRAALNEARKGWLPSAESVNALPVPVRDYIHALETRCDPAGLVAENTILKDTCEGLQKMYRRVVDEGVPLTVGQYEVSRPVGGRVYIRHSDSGEGGSFREEVFAAWVDKFYKENF